MSSGTTPVALRCQDSVQDEAAFGQTHPEAVDRLGRGLFGVARGTQRHEQRGEVFDGRVRLRHTGGFAPECCYPEQVRKSQVSPKR